MNPPEGHTYDDAADPGHELVGGSRLARNGALTLVTGLVLLLASLAVVPFMIRSFGRELYGVLAITWMVLAHLNWLDFGFSRSTAKFVAHDLALGRRSEASLWAWTALLTQAALGTAGAAGLWIAAPFLASALEAGEETSGLVVLTLRLFALAIPIDLAWRSLTGVLQAGQRFGLANAIASFTALATYSIYVVGILRGGDFRAVIYGLFIVRVVQLVLSFTAATRVLPELRQRPTRDVLRRCRRCTGQMLRFGSWVTVATMIGPLLLYFDQWVIGVLIGVAGLPFYVVPLNLLSRLAVFPSSMTAILFPAFSALEARSEWDRIENFFVRAHRYLLIVLVPASFVIYAWAPEMLRLWLGSDFAEHASGPLRIMVIGFAIGLLAPLTGALLEGVGRPDVLAKIYLAELPVNLLVVVLLTRAFGLQGAALSFTIRTIAETIILWVVIVRVVPLSGEAAALARRTGGQVAAAGLMLTLAILLLPDASISDPISIAGTLAVLTVLIAAVPALFMDHRDRAFLARQLPRLRARRLPRPDPI